MKKIITFLSIILVVTCMFALTTKVSADSITAPWHTDDNDDFSAWTVEGQKVSGTSVSSKRVWKEIANKNDFTVEYTIEFADKNSRCWVRQFGIDLEINPQGGNGNQVFLKYNAGGDWTNINWLDATGMKLTVEAKRTDGGEIYYTMTGEGNDTPVVGHFPARNADEANLEFKLDGSGSVTCTKYEVAEEAPATPAITAPWHTDDNDDFSAWTVEGQKVSGTSVSSKRVWKEIANKNDFTVEYTIEFADKTSRCWVRQFGIDLEINPQGGNGNQVFLKYNAGGDWTNINWLDATGMKLTVEAKRTDGGEIYYTMTGEGNDTPVVGHFPARNADEANLEFKLDGSGSVTCTKYEVTEEAPEEPATPTLPAWHTDDNDDFSAWTVEGEKISGTSIGNKRVWKEVSNKNDFTVEYVIELNSSSRCWVRQFGIDMEINPQGGNGNQVFLKYCTGGDWNNIDWLNATGCKVTVEAKRTDGGDVYFTITGEGNATPFSGHFAPKNADEANLEFKLDGTGSVTCTKLETKEETPETPAIAAWKTDNDDFSGWTADGEKLSGADMGNKRVWKEIANKNDFTVEYTIELNSSSRCWVRQFGIDMEINPQGGNGNQVFLKYCTGGDWTNIDWLNATGCKIKVEAKRTDGGDVYFTITGEGNATPFSGHFAPKNADEANLEFKLDGTGSVECTKFEVTEASGTDPVDPTDPTDPTDTTIKDAFEAAGWTNVDNGDDFTGWSIDTTTGTISGKNGSVYRIKNELITNQNDFTITANYDLSANSSVFFKVISIEFELDSRHASHEQVYIKGIANGDWIDAQSYAGTITIKRENGGKIVFTVTGNGNETIMTGERDASKASSFLELGFYAGDGVLTNLTVTCKESTEPTDPVDPTDPTDPTESPFVAEGWEVQSEGTFELKPGDFSGWEFLNEEKTSISGVWMDMENIVIAKNLLTDKDNFSLQFIVKTDFFSSPTINILGIRLELDGNHGDGNQVFVKKDAQGVANDNSWFYCEDDTVYVNITRTNGGNLFITLYGVGNSSPMQLEWVPAEETTEVKLILYRGEAEWRNISVGQPGRDDIKPADAGEVDPVIPVTQAPSTQAPATQAPSTQAPATQAPATQAPTTPTKKGCKSSLAVSVVPALVLMAFGLVAIKKRRED